LGNPTIPHLNPILLSVFRGKAAGRVSYLKSSCAAPTRASILLERGIAASRPATAAIS
jgi:hypothetical protein